MFYNVCVYILLNVGITRRRAGLHRRMTIYITIYIDTPFIDNTIYFTIYMYTYN